MSITLNTDLSLLASRLNLTTEQLGLYKNKSVKDIVEAEAAQGNAQAQALLSKILNDPTELAKVFKLVDVNNKYAILRNLSEHDLKNILPMLDPQDLVVGLNFFTKDKLLKLVGELPKEQLVKYVQQMYSPEQLMQLMPEKSMDKVLQNPALDKSLVLKHLKEMKPEILAQMLEAATGKPVKDMDPAKMIQEVATLSDSKYRMALMSIPSENKRDFMLRMAKEDSKVLELFDADSYVGVIANREKPELVKSAQALDQDQLVKMVGQLPEDLLSVVCTQIDPNKFAGMLIANFKEVLSQIIAA